MKMNKVDALSLQFAHDFPASFAKAIVRFGPDEVCALLNSMPNGIAAGVAARLSSNRLNTVLASGLAKPDAWLEAASFDDAVAILGLMPRERCMALVDSVENRVLRRRLRQYLSYPAHSVGSLVSGTLVRFQHDLAIKEIFLELQSHQAQTRPPAIVIEQDGKYLGLLRLWQVTVRGLGGGVARDFAEQVSPMRPETPLVNAMHAELWRNHQWLPVVDHEQRLLGVVSQHQIIERLRQKGAAESTIQGNISMLGTQYLNIMGALLGRLLETGRKL